MFWKYYLVIGAILILGYGVMAFSGAESGKNIIKKETPTQAALRARSSRGGGWGYGK